MSRYITDEQAAIIARGLFLNNPEGKRFIMWWINKHGIMGQNNTNSERINTIRDIVLDLLDLMKFDYQKEISDFINTEDKY